MKWSNVWTDANKQYNIDITSLRCPYTLRKHQLPHEPKRRESRMVSRFSRDMAGSAEMNVVDEA